MQRDAMLEQIAGTAPEITAGYAEIRGVIESDGAIPAATKALLAAAAAAARGYDALARSELARGRALGNPERDIADAGVSLPLPRGEVICQCFADVPTELVPADKP